MEMQHIPAARLIYTHKPQTDFLVTTEMMSVSEKQGWQVEVTYFN